MSDNGEQLFSTGLGEPSLTDKKKYPTRHRPRCPSIIFFYFFAVGNTTRRGRREVTT